MFIVVVFGLTSLHSVQFHICVCFWPLICAFHTCN